MNVPLRKPWTREEFFAWAETQDTRYEFDGFQPVAMTGGNAGHSRVIRGLHRALNARLLGGPCEPLGPDAGVETVNKAFRYPDGLVTCSKLENDVRAIPNVVVVFEVFGPTSGREDRITKVREYAAVPSIRRYVILESSSVGMMVMERSSPDQVWQTTVLTQDDILRMPEIGIEIPVAEIYEAFPFPARIRPKRKGVRPLVMTLAEVGHAAMSKLFSPQAAQTRVVLEGGGRYRAGRLPSLRSGPRSILQVPGHRGSDRLLRLHPGVRLHPPGAFGRRVGSSWSDGFGW